MEFVYGVLGFVLLTSGLTWYRERKATERRRREELYTLTIRELIAALKKCDPDRRVIIADLKYANYDIAPGNLLLDIIDPEK